MPNRTVVLILTLTLLLAACGGATDRTRAVEVAWAALEPNSASHDRANWTVVQARQTLGWTVAKEFEQWVFFGNCGGPEPPRNHPVDPWATYWYVRMEPLPATPTGVSPRPEPAIARASFLIDDGGQVIARALICIWY